MGGKKCFVSLAQVAIAIALLQELLVLGLEVVLQDHTVDVGAGPRLAGKIVAHREQHGAFAARAQEADLGEEVDRAAWEWYEAQPDKRGAFRMLVAIGSAHTLRAASARSTGWAAMISSAWAPLPANKTS